MLAFIFQNIQTDISMLSCHVWSIGRKDIKFTFTILNLTRNYNSFTTVTSIVSWYFTKAFNWTAANWTQYFPSSLCVTFMATHQIVMKSVHMALETGAGVKQWTACTTFMPHSTRHGEVRFIAVSDGEVCNQINISVNDRNITSLARNHYSCWWSKLTDNLRPI